MSIALIGIQQHYQIQKVTEALRGLGADVVVMDVTVPKRIEIGTSAEDIFCRYDGRDLRDNHVVWQCLKQSLSPFGQSEEWLANYINGTQWSSVLYNLMMSLRRQIKVINDPVATMVSSYKLDQLQTAQRLGMAVPASFISNSLGAISQAFDADIPLITKALGNPHIPQIRDGAVSQTTITTSRVDRGLLQEAECDLDPHPSFVQAEVVKRYEIRTVAVGEHFFSCKIDSHRHKIMELDYRMGSAMVDYQPMATPDAIRTFATAYLRHYGLTSGSFDFIVDRQGELIFLECNPEGIWGIIDKTYQGAVAAAFAETLLIHARG